MRPKILFISDGINYNSGFANVIRRLLYYFHEEGYEVAQLAWAYTGFPPITAPFQVFPINPGKSYFGADVFPTVLDIFKPDIVFTLGDCYAIDWLVKNERRKDFKWIAYIPIDSDPIPSKSLNKMERGWLTVLEGPDKVIFMAKYGEEQARKVCNFENEPITIYHGFDEKSFYPLNKLFARSRNGIDHFETIFSVVCTNSERKQNPRVLEAFKLFAEEVGENKVSLYMHTAIRETRDGYYLDEVIGSLNVKNVTFGQGLHNGFGSGIDAVRMAYTIADAHVLPSSAEGFGLPILESAACGIPTVGINYSSVKELVEGHGYLIQPSDWIYSKPYCMRRPLISIEGLVEAMLDIHLNKDKAEELGQKALEFSKDLTWEKILPNFIKVVKEVSELDG